jgi:N-acetylneuraminate synthase
MVNLKQIEIAGAHIGYGRPAYVIAEAGVNHNGDVNLARQLVDVAVAAGADAIKFQTFRAEAMVSRDAQKAQYQLETTDAAESQFEMLQRLELSVAAHHQIYSYCEKSKITFLSTPFDAASADLLDDLGVPAFKISSGDLTNLPLLSHVATKRKPVLLSTGMANLEEVADAVQVVSATGNEQIVLLQCVSNYPADAGDVNLRAMITMADAFNVPVGYSDHTNGIEVALAAVALGAMVIEKHFTLDRNLPGPDHRASLEPPELQAMISGIRKVEVALGNGEKRPALSELNTASVARRSLTAAMPITAGTTLTREMVAMKRPGTGLPPRALDELIGRVFRVNVPSGTMLSPDMFE